MLNNVLDNIIDGYKTPEANLNAKVEMLFECQEGFSLFQSSRKNPNK